jgi:3-oxoadipate enol-lactonase
VPIADINGHSMYFETHGSGEPVLCMGGWGTYCHGSAHHLGGALLARHRVIIFDHRGLGQSGDDPSVAPTTKLYAADAAGLLDHLGVKRTHVVGMVGLGACIAQELALARPDLVKSMTNMGSWARPDMLFRHQLESLRDVHGAMGWADFQKLVCAMSFEGGFYEENHHRLIGPDGPWRELKGRYAAHARLIEACLAHDTLDRLNHIVAPSLIIHLPLDQVTGPRLTLPIERGIPGARGVALDGAAHVVAGKTLRARFSELLLGFLAEVDAKAGAAP